MDVLRTLFWSFGLVVFLLGIQGTLYFPLTIAYEVWKRRALRRLAPFRGGVTVVVPACNEERTIRVAVETLRAGADIFLVCHNQDLVWRSYEAVLREAERDRKFAALVAKAAARILSFKKRSPEMRGFAAEPKPSVVEKLKEMLLTFSNLAAPENASRRFPEVSA